MKKLIACMATILMFVTFTPIHSEAIKNTASISVTEKESAELIIIINRINEINAMDRSTMSRSEKREIRNELRALKREATTHSGGGVYISTGVLVLIIVLIIIF